MTQQKSGWITKEPRKKGDVWVYHHYTTRPSDGKRVEHTATIGPALKFPREADAWEEVARRSENGEAKPGSRLTIAKLANSYINVELPSKAHSTRELHEHVVGNYIIPRWGKQYVDEVRVLELRKW